MRITEAQIESMVRFEDEAVVVVHKPPFLAVETRNPRRQDLVSLLKNRRFTRKEEAYIGLVHRLDQPVEGLLVLAKTPMAARVLSEGLVAGDFTKEYLAVVMGAMPAEGALIHTIKKNGRTNRADIVPEGTAGGKEARLSYERLAVSDEKSLLVVRLDTGRHHQIRVQLAAGGHPLWGDEKYGACAAELGPGAYNDARPGQKIPPALCSSRLAFVHPISGKRLELCTKPTGAGFLPFVDIIDHWLPKC